jgi:hypothetical protein
LYGPIGINIISGASIAETGGSTASVVFKEGASTGRILGQLNFAANASNPSPDFPEVICNGQVYLLITGTVAGAIYLR